jgi:transcription antitermination factor NusG
MPILPAEPTLFPQELLDYPPSSDAKRSWYVIYTKSRQEKALGRDLCRWEVPFFLPTIPKENYIRGRVIRSHVPLFQGYVFVFGTDEDRVTSLTTNRVSRMLPVQDQAKLRQDLRQIRDLIESGAPLTLERRLGPGRHVRVKAGQLAGMEGTVVCRRGMCRLIVAVNFLQQGASVEIDDFLLEPLD